MPNNENNTRVSFLVKSPSRGRTKARRYGLRRLPSWGKLSYVVVKKDGKNGGNGYNCSSG